MGMDIRKFVVLILLFIIILDHESDAFSITKLRKSVSEVQNPNFTKEIPPSSSPISSNNESHPKPIRDEKFDLIKPNVSYEVDPTISNKTNLSDRKDNIDDKSDSQDSTGENCDQSSTKCMDQNKMVACVLSFRIGKSNREVIILVQNEGNDTLKVNLTDQASAEDSVENIEIPRHQSKMINHSVTVGESSTIVLSSGHGDCIIQLGLPVVSKSNYLFKLPSYSQPMTPINAAYLMLLTAIIFGCGWACFKCIKKERREEVGYQEIEMGLPESASTLHRETSNGWNDGWDDDWEDHISANNCHVSNVSAGGLISRSSNRDRWENDFDED